MKETVSYTSYERSPYRSIKHTTYFQVYDRLFGAYRGEPITFVEIGVLNGGSLFMWRDFFGPTARIIWVDLNPNAKKWENHGFEIFIGSQTDKEFWKDFISKVGPIDIVLDDGGHTYEQQIITAECLLEGLKDKGILVVEDTHTSYMNGFGPKRYSFVEYVKQLIDRINYRFGKFHKRVSEDRIWSIEIFESIIAFKINRVATSIQSKPTDNGRNDDQAFDFRHENNNAVTIFNSLSLKLFLLKKIPFVKRLAIVIKNKITNRKSNAKEFLSVKPDCNPFLSA